jgi:DNA helicase IV
MTGHGSKGLEFDHVYFLDQHLIGKEEQEPNLRYVIATRARGYADVYPDRRLR